MKEKDQTTWAAVGRDLQNASLFPKQRDTLLAHALQQVLISTPAVGAALIWPCKERKVPWKVYYAGNRREAMHRWLSARLDPSLDAMLGVLQQDPSGGLLEMPPPLLLPLRPLPLSSSGLWIVWATPASQAPLPGSTLEHIERVRQTLEGVLEVEEREEHYFSQSSPLADRDFIEALAHGDDHALSAFLSLTRIVVKADFTFWARAYQDVVEITGHLGAKHSGFGFTLLHGQGVGGRVAAYGTMVLGDYRTSPYRDSSVCDLVDSELIRSGVALPVRYGTAQDTQARVAAVLYATRRSVSRFSQAELLLAQRLARLLEPLPFANRPASFSLPDVPPAPDYKTRWYDLALHARRIEEIEAWISQFIKGPAIITDHEDSPYIFAHTQQLEQLRAGPDEKTQILSLAAPGVLAPGQVYLCPSIPLPPPQWPTFFADLIMACNLVILRMEQAQDQLNRQREQWLRALLHEKSSPYLENDAYRLGLPIKRGQLWVLVWQHEALRAMKAARWRMTAETVVLDLLQSPLLFFEDEIAVVLLDEQTSVSSSALRNALLKYGTARLLWVVDGGHYRSFADLKIALTRAISLAQKARREKYEEYLLDVSMFGLDSLLENPHLAGELNTFATRLLKPLIEYDSLNGSQFTETLVLAHTLGSAQAVADQFAVHVNTIRYRLHRAEDILGRDPTSLKEQTAITLAAFIWAHFHPY